MHGYLLGVAMASPALICAFIRSKLKEGPNQHERNVWLRDDDDGNWLADDDQDRAQDRRDAEREASTSTAPDMSAASEVRSVSLSHSILNTEYVAAYGGIEIREI